MKNRDVYKTEKLHLVYDHTSPKAFIYYYPSERLMALVGIINTDKDVFKNLEHWLNKEYSYSDLYYMYNLFEK